LLGDRTIEIRLDGTNVLMAGCTHCTVPDTYPSIPAVGATIYSTIGAPTAGNSNLVNSLDPINDIAADTKAIGDTVKAAAADSLNAKVIDLQIDMK
jgi:hypothetical protein